MRLMPPLGTVMTACYWEDKRVSRIVWFLQDTGGSGEVVCGAAAGPSACGLARGDTEVA